MEDPAKQKWKKKSYYVKLYQQKLGKGKEILRSRKYYDPVKEPREGLSKNDQEADLFGAIYLAAKAK